MVDILIAWSTDNAETIMPLRDLESVENDKVNKVLTLTFRTSGKPKVIKFTGHERDTAYQYLMDTLVMQHPNLFMPSQIAVPRPGIIREPGNRGD